MHTHSFQIESHLDKDGIDLAHQNEKLSDIKPKNHEVLSQSVREIDYRNKKDFVEIKEFVQNPQEQTLNSVNSARSKSQDESQHDTTKVSPRSALNQSIMNCLICYDKLPDAVLMDCGHGGQKK